MGQPADLFRIKGIASEYSDLLEEAGVDTVVELSKRVPENLYAKMVEVNKKKNLVNKLPGVKQVKKWIDQAKKLPQGCSILDFSLPNNSCTTASSRSSGEEVFFRQLSNFDK